MPWTLIGILVYLAAGVGVMLWIRQDNEFRYADTGDMLAYVSIVLWPVTAILWVFTRPEEQLQNLDAKKTHQDFRNFMKERKEKGDLLENLKATTVENPLELQKVESEFRDYHIEELMDKKEWMEALRTSNDMLRFAREQQEYDRVIAYEGYVKRIKELRARDQ
ncbi:MAG TPA: hypothetical protein VGB30_05185 [bacterium]